MLTADSFQVVGWVCFVSANLKWRSPCLHVCYATEFNMTSE
jgi:hypothetical protein